jgi:hypothetical protein
MIRKPKINNLNTSKYLEFLSYGHRYASIRKFYNFLDCPDNLSLDLGNGGRGGTIKPG